MKKAGLDCTLKVKGFIDTLNVASKMYEHGEDLPNLKQATFVSHLLKVSYDEQNAAAHVEAIQKLYPCKMKPSVILQQDLLFQFATHVHSISFRGLVSQKISQALSYKMSHLHIRSSHLKEELKKVINLY